MWVDRHEYKKGEQMYIRFPWHVKFLAFIFKPRFKPDQKYCIKTIRKYQKIGKKRYAFDYDFDIKKKKFKCEIKIIF